MIQFFFLIMVLATNAFAGISDIETAVMDRDYETARSLSSTLMRNSSDPKERLQAQYYLGLSQLRLGKFAESRKTFEHVMQAHPSGDLYDKAAVGHIESLHMAGFYRDVVSEAEHFLIRYPKSSYLSVVYFKLARANLKLMNWQKANDLLTKIVKDFPQSMEASLAKQLLEEKQYFAVQVGSFNDKTRAVDLANNLKDSKYYAYLVETVSGNNEKFYRVRVGQITSLEKAKDLERQLLKLGYSTLIFP